MDIPIVNENNIILNSIVSGDCLSVMKHIPDDSVDIIITSPPYNLLNSTGNGMKGASKRWKNAALVNGYDGYDDNMSFEEYVLWQKDCLREMFRIIKDTGAIFYNNKNRVQNNLLEDRGVIVHGFPLRQVIIWQRAGGINFNDTYYVPTTEQIYMICKPKFRLNKMGNRYGDVWNITQEHNNPHPAPFPVTLVDRILDTVYINGRGVILDPFAGSGTVGVSALKHNMDFMLIEQSEEYCKMAQSRLSGIEEWRNPSAQYISQSLFGEDDNL